MIAPISDSHNHALSRVNSSARDPVKLELENALRKVDSWELDLSGTHLNKFGSVGRDLKFSKPGYQSKESIELVIAFSGNNNIRQIALKTDSDLKFFPFQEVQMPASVRQTLTKAYFDMLDIKAASVEDLYKNQNP